MPFYLKLIFLAIEHTSHHLMALKPHSGYSARMKTISFKHIPTLNVLKEAYPGTKALFFDMDGTLFNTEAHHEQAFLKIGHDYKIRPPHSPEVIHALLMGKADYLVYNIVKEWENFPKHWSVEDFVNAKNEALLKILAQVDPTTFFPSQILDLLKAAQAENIYLALVTSSEKIITQKLLEIASVTSFFELILTRDDCPNHKPHPWPYLHAIKQSSLSPHEIIIFEDSNVGLEAATASGAHVIKVEWF